MDRDSALALLAQHREAFAGLQVKSLALFGSVARGTARPDSDVDILVEFHGPATFDQYVRLREFLERMFARRVDLVTRRSIKSALRQQIIEQATDVA